MLREDLVGDADNTLPLLHLMFADDQITEAHQLYRLKLLVVLLPLRVRLILFSVVIGGISKVVIPVDFLVQICCLFVIVCKRGLEKIGGRRLESEHSVQLLFHAHFVEVHRIGGIKQSQSKEHFIILFDNLVLIEEMGSKVSQKLISPGSCHFDHPIFFHAFYNLDDQRGQGVSV
jgi:hypothetical protein